jgi:exopolysaccharide biosynthesis polyprenyl glycosylphosphotransferase
MKNKDKNTGKFYYDSVLWVIELMDTVLITIPFTFCWALYYSNRIESPFYNKGNWLVVVIFFFLFVSLGRIYEGFTVSLFKASEIVFSQFLAIFFTDIIMYLIIMLLSKGFIAIWPLLLTFLIQDVLSVVWAFGAQRWYFHAFAAGRTAVIYDTREGIEMMVKEYGLEKKFNILHTISAEECLSNNFKQINDMEVVFLCGVHSHERNIILKRCIVQNISVYMLPRIGDILVSGAKRMHILNMPMLRVSRYSPSPGYILFKRASDIILSVLAIAILSPVMLIAAMTIKLTDGGPVLYRQCRLTKNGRIFILMKFRSMFVDAESNGVACLSTGDKDERITQVGKFIRRFRIDELPQFFNILKGDMSVVGPRPERPEIVSEYEKDLPEFAMRLQVKAGLTGYAQVHGKYNTTPYDKLQMDLMYIAHPSVWEDLAIILATVKVLFLKRSTEGTAKGQTTASESDEGNNS